MPARRAFRIRMRLNRRVAARIETAAILRDPVLMAQIREAEAELAHGEVYALDDSRQGRDATRRPRRWRKIARGPAQATQPFPRDQIYGPPPEEWVAISVRATLLLRNYALANDDGEDALTHLRRQVWWLGALSDEDQRQFLHEVTWDTVSMLTSGSTERAHDRFEAWRRKAQELDFEFHRSHPPAHLPGWDVVEPEASDLPELILRAHLRLPRETLEWQSARQWLSAGRDPEPVRAIFHGARIW